MLRLKYQVELADQLGNMLSRCTGKALSPQQTTPIINQSFITKSELEIQEKLNHLRGS